MNQKTEYITKLPGFIIGGAPKSGTTKLSRYLSKHNPLFMPEQGMNFYAFYEQEQNYSMHQINHPNNFEEYNAHFQFNTNEKNCLSGEKSVSYFYVDWCENIIKNIKSLHPNADEIKFIFILRQPVDRMFSQFVFNTGFDEKLSFEEAIEAWANRKKSNWLPAYDYVGASKYTMSIATYQQAFKHVKVYLFEDLVGQKEWLLTDLARYLDIDEDAFKNMPEKQFNTGYMANSNFAQQVQRIQHLPILKKMTSFILSENRKKSLKSRFFNKAILDTEIRKKWTNEFTKDILALEKLIGRDLKHWLV